MTQKPTIRQAMVLLKRLAKRSPEVVKGFLDSLNSPLELLKINFHATGAAGALKATLIPEPSDRLLGFLATSGTRHVENR